MTGHWTPTALHVRNGEKRMSSALMCIVTRQASMPMCRPCLLNKLGNVGASEASIFTRTSQKRFSLPRNGEHFQKKNVTTTQNRKRQRVLLKGSLMPKCGESEQRTNHNTFPNCILTITTR